MATIHCSAARRPTSSIGGSGNDFARLGAGDDVFVWNPGDGSDTVEGQAGSDTLRFNGAVIAETIDVSASAGRAFLHRDIANITMNTNDVEHFEINALGGADTINIHDLAGSELKHVAVNLGGTLGAPGGDGQADTIVIDGTSGDDAITIKNVNGVIIVSGLGADIAITNFEAGDHLVINGLGGDDVIDASGLSGMLFAANGGDGNDVLIGSCRRRLPQRRRRRRCADRRTRPRRSRRRHGRQHRHPERRRVRADIRTLRNRGPSSGAVVHPGRSGHKPERPALAIAAAK